MMEKQRRAQNIRRFIVRLIIWSMAFIAVLSFNAALIYWFVWHEFQSAVIHTQIAIFNAMFVGVIKE